MKVIVKENDFGVSVTAVAEGADIDAITLDVMGIVFDSENLPNEPQESWVIEDGAIKINQQKLIEFKRKNMPTLSPIEFDIKLNNAKLYDAVQDLIKDNFEMRIAYNRATFFSRTDSFVDQAQIALNLTDDQVDEMWTS